MRILIATGIYPPAVGGPSQYAKNVKMEWEKKGYMVKVRTFRFERYLPSGFRHFFYFLKIIPEVLWCDFIFILDTFSVGWPATCAAKLFGKKVIIRTGGDFLWEGYVERNKELVLLRDFYQTTQKTWSQKERLIFRMTKWTLHHTDALIFSTKWQRDIWYRPYNLEKIKLFFVENYYGLKEESFKPKDKEFIASTRPLVWKNLDVLKEVGVKIHLENSPYKEFMDKLAHAYAVILVSLGDISPNLILDAIRYNKPFIITEENGLMDRIRDIAIIVNPKNPSDIKNKVLWLCEKDNYNNQVKKIKNFNFLHTWKEIADEIIDIWKTI
ncbi:MAG: Glycosyl transferase, group 1 [Parcubacteria group bacterium GW2011_GWC1_43_30]|nr:MAG: Glycosyl transferase, group 1 [Parcubacteria group bacterium GW2011_GWC1_43_30]